MLETERFVIPRGFRVTTNQLVCRYLTCGDEGNKWFVAYPTFRYATNLLICRYLTTRVVANHLVGRYLSSQVVTNHVIGGIPNFSVYNKSTDLPTLQNKRDDKTAVITAK